jgi:peptide/nickel transport system substrate-binding protein
MDSRFTFKDFVFVVLFVAVIGAGIWMSAQFGYQERRLTQVREDLEKLSRTQQEQLTVLEDIRQALRSGVRVGDAGGGPAGGAGTAKAVVREPRPNNGMYVYFRDPPRSPRDPRNQSDYARGDWLVDNLGSEPAVVTPYIEKDAYGGSVQDSVLETMIIRNPETLEYEPFLAESYEIIPDKLLYRFVLRDNIWFSDKTKVTADDVVFSYQTVMTPGVESDRYQSYLKQIESVTKVDDRTVEVKLKEPYFEGLSLAGAGWGILPRHIYQFKDAQEYNRRTDLLVGSGPYVFNPKLWSKGQKIELPRNENYWGERPTFDKVVFRFITNQQAALQAFQNEEIDEFTPAPDQYVQFSKDPAFLAKFQAFQFKRPNAGYRYIGWNTARPMFADKLTRLALTELIDRAAIIQTIEKGMSYEITGPFSPMVPQADPSIKPWPYDPADAKKKLAEAGWKMGSGNTLERAGKPFRFSLMIPAQSQNYEQIAVYVKQEFAKVGIDVTVSPFEFSVLVDKLDSRDFDASMLRWTGSVEDDPYQIWHSDSIKDKGSNYISFRNQEMDKLIEAGRKELNEEKRMEIWHKVHQIIHDEQPYTFLHASMSSAFVNGRFKNTAPYKVGMNSSDWYVPTLKQKYR